MEEKAADALEVAAKANEEREKAEKAAQGDLRIIINLILCFLFQILKIKT